MNAENAYDFLRRTGLRITPLKKAVVEYFLEGACGVSAGEVLGSLGDSHDQSSVYRCLESLVKAGFLKHSPGSRGVVEYRCRKPFIPDHGHFNCRGCGRTMPLENRFASEMVKNIRRELGVSIDSVDFILEGKCRSCSEL